MVKDIYPCLSCAQGDYCLNSNLQCVSLTSTNWVGRDTNGNCLPEITATAIYCMTSYCLDSSNKC